MPLLPLLFAIPVVGVLICLLAGRVSQTAVRVASALVAGVGLLSALALLAMVHNYGPVRFEAPWIPPIGSSFLLLGDGISAPLAVLAAALLLVAALTAQSEITDRSARFHACLHAATAGVQLVFLAGDAFLFYFGYELMLIPMFLLIGGWGHENRNFAATRFLLFTFGGSIFLLAAILFLHAEGARLDGVRSFSIEHLASVAGRLPIESQFWVYLGLLLGFGVKIPLFPLHTWLPETYTQSPTAGNVVLAGVMSKTGLYGLLRLGETLAPAAAVAYAPYVILLALVGIFLAAFAAFAQRDIKRVIAYSSISHLGMAAVAVLIATDGDSAGTKAAVLIMVAHGISTAGLFIAAGLVHRHARTRELEAFGGLWPQAPALGGFLLFFTMASLGLPGTANFVGEIYVIAESFRQNAPLGILLAVAVVFAAAYSLRLYILTMHGPASTRVKNLPEVQTLDASVLAALAATSVVLGFAPQAIAPVQANVASPNRAAAIEARAAAAGYTLPVRSADQPTTTITTAEAAK